MILRLEKTTPPQTHEPVNGGLCYPLTGKAVIAISKIPKVVGTGEV
jgi:hypothetical protein